mgnify:CR=1 FL=1
MPSNPGAIDPTRLTPEQLATLLKSAGYADASTESVEEDIANGCPTGDGGVISFVVYVAWLLENRRG